MNDSPPISGDRRLFADRKRKLVVAVNYKAGWSTFNRSLGQQSGIDLLPPSRLAEVGGEGYRLILFMRPPLSRLVSYINDKIILRRGNLSLVLNTMKAWNARDVMDEIQAARGDSHALQKAIDAFVPYLQVLIQQDRHLHPQHWLYTRLGLGPDVFDAILDYRNNIDFLESTFDLDVEIGNVTKSENIRDVVATPRVKEFCMAWYGIDQLVWDTRVSTEIALGREVRA